jgi:hypothetical protein
MWLERGEVAWIIKNNGYSKNVQIPNILPLAEINPCPVEVGWHEKQ